MQRRGAGGGAPATSLRGWSNDKLGKCLYLTDLKTRQGICVRVIIAAFYSGLAAGVIAVGYYFRTRLHIVYWLGYWPQVTMLVFMFALAGSFLLITRVRITRYFRFQELRGPRGGTRGGFEDYELKKTIGTNTDMGRLRPMVLFSALLAVASIGCGLGTEIQVRSVGSDLAHACTMSDSSRVKQMQEVSDSLVKFQLACNENAEIAKYITECEGYDSRFKDSKYVDYLMRLESQYHCTGFCKSTVPLYFLGRTRMEDSDSNDSCSVAIANDVFSVSLLIALPAVFIGVGLCMVALVFYGYDYL